MSLTAYATAVSHDKNSLHFCIYQYIIWIMKPLLHSINMVKQIIN